MNAVTLRAGMLFLALAVVASAQSHFNPPSSNYQPMNIYVIEAKLNGQDLISGDEVAVFDGSTCAGVEVVDQVATSSNPIGMIAYKANNGDTGFTEGNPMIFKCWDASLGVEHTFDEDEVLYFDSVTGDPVPPKNFEGHASIMVALDGAADVSTYNLTMQTRDGGTTSPAPGTYNYSAGTVVNIEAIPNSGWQFDYWEGSVDDPNSATTTVTMNGNKTVTAHFTCVEHTLTMSVDPPGTGTTTPSPGDTIVCEGEQITVTATPAEGYEFVNWSGNVANPNSATTTVDMTSDQSVTAHFQAVSPTDYTLTMQVNQSGWGATTPPVGTHEYTLNEVVNITATPSAGYEFVHWTGDVADPNSASTTVTMSSNKTVTANFQRVQYDLTMQVNESGWGSTTPSVGTHAYNSGDMVSILATPNSGYQFVKWTGDVADPNNASTTITINNDETVRANFERVQYTLTIQDTEGGSTSPAAGSYTYYSGDVVSISATADAGYNFVNWSGDVSDPNAASTTVVMDDDKTISANFASDTTYPLTITASPSAGGTTDPIPGTHNYAENEMVQVTAIPNSGYHFVNWTGDASGTDSVITITMDAEKNITANFALNSTPQHTLTMKVNQSGWGSTDPAVGNHNYDEDTVVNIRALPAEGYRFVNWTGAVGDNNASETTVYMDGDKTVTANFEAIPQYTLTMQTDPSDGSGGTTTPSPGTHDYYENTKVQVEAFPNEGYRFDYWTGNVDDVNSPTATITMNTHETVTAHFVAIPVYTITIAAPADPLQGTTDPEPGTYELYENEEMTIRAIPAAGYQFKNWNNDPSLTNATITVKANSNKTYTPYFEQIDDVTLTMDVDDTTEGDVIPAIGQHIYKRDEQVTIEARPEPGYRFVQWEIDGTFNSYYDAEMTITMDDDKRVVAHFDHIMYRLMMSSSPSNGGTTTPSAGTHEYKSWKTVSITATPEPGYKFTGWTGDVDDPQSASTTVVMSGDQQVRANFAPSDQYTLNVNVSPSGGGTTNPAVGTHQYNYNETVTVTATANSGYSFKEWLGDVADPTSATTTIQIDEDKNITAVFEEEEPETYELTMRVNPSSGGSTTPAAGATYEYAAGEVVTITATPASGYHFDSWSGDVQDPTSLTTTVTMDANKTVTANFQPGSNEYNFTIDVHPPGSGTTSPAQGSYYYQQGTVVNVSASPASGYVFDYWTGDVAEPYNPNTTVTIDSDKSVIAHFVEIPQYTLTMQVDPSGGGSVIPAVGQHQYNENAQVTIQATPASGYEFVNWSGDVADPSSPTTTVTMDDDKTVKAVFQQKSNQALLTMQIDPAGGGNTGPEPGTHVFNLNDKIYITAVPNPGYTFSHWTGEVNNTNEATTFVILNKNKTVTAHFTQGQPDRATLTISSNPSSGGVTDPSAGSYDYDLQEVVTISATSAAGYEFVGWTGDVADPTSPTTTVTMDANKSVIANFESDGSDSYVLSMNTSPVGTGSTAPAPGIHTYGKDEMVSISAIPHDGYYFAGWVGEVEDPDAPTTRVKMDKDKEVYATFEPGEPDTYTLTILVSPAEGGLTAPAVGTYTYEENETVNITTVHNPGYVFKSWSGGVEDSTSQTTRVKMTGNKTVIANFEKVAVDQYTLTIVVKPAGAGVTVPSEGSHAYDANELVNVAATAADGYTFSHWTGDVANLLNANTSIQMTGNKTIIANFKADTYTVTLTAAPVGSGILTPSIGDTSVSAGDVITISATPADGYRFAFWSGDVSGDSNPLSVTVERNLRITAQFVDLEEEISKPALYATATAFRQQPVDVFVRDASSSLGHDLEYQFDWGDGQLSPWMELTSQHSQNITTITTPVGGSGLPNSGSLIDYNTGEPSDIVLSVTGGTYAGKLDAWTGAEPFEGTDAWDVFHGVLHSRGAITYLNTPNDKLQLEFSGLDPNKLYILVFYANRNDYGWSRASQVTLSGADGFVNLSSKGKDNIGEPLFDDAFAPNTKLPSDNTYTGYIARYANIAPGADGNVVLSIKFAGAEGAEFKGKYGSAVLLQEIDPSTSATTFTGFNDLAWDGNFVSHQFMSSGSYLIRARARCKNHTSAVSPWSNAHSILISGVHLNTAITAGANAVVNRVPDQPDYNYGAQVTLVASSGKNWVFSHWNNDKTDTLASKVVHANNHKSLQAHFKLLASVNDANAEMPKEFALQQNFPNPFNPTTQIHYDLPEPSHVKIEIYDIRGRHIRTLVNWNVPAGRHTAVWDALDSHGLKVSTGLYFYKMVAGEFVDTRRMVLLK